MKVKINLAAIMDLIRSFHPAQNLNVLYEIEAEPVATIKNRIYETPELLNETKTQKE